jgi:hypothetical protein
MLTVAALVSLALVVGCRQPDPEGHMRAESRTTLFSVCKLVYLAESETEEPPPVKLGPLVTWLAKNASAEESYIDYKQGTIKDAWGRPITVIAEDGRFVGVGSSGPDGHWQSGEGDDIVVTLQDVRR